jgi:hypothetical protein
MNYLIIGMNYKIIDQMPNRHGLRRVMSNNKYGLINQENKLICNIEYDEIEFPYNIIHIMVKRNGKWTSIDKYGNNKITLQMDSYSDFFQTNPEYAVVKVNDQAYIIDRFGNIVTGDRFRFESIGDIELFGNKFAFFFSQDETRIIAYDIETKERPDFWMQIYNGCMWVTNALDLEYDMHGNLLYKTVSKEYTIDKNGNIIKIEPLQFRTKIVGIFAKYIAAPLVRQEIKRNKNKNKT